MTRIGVLNPMRAHHSNMSSFLAIAHFNIFISTTSRGFSPKHWARTTRLPETTEVTRIDSDSHRCAAFNRRFNQYYLYITCAPYIALSPQTVNAIPLDPLSWLQVSQLSLSYISILSSSTRHSQETLLTPVLADDRILEGLAKDGKMD